MPLGLGRRPGTQGQCNHPTPRTTILRTHFRSAPRSAVAETGCRA